MVNRSAKAPREIESTRQPNLHRYAAQAAERELAPRNRRGLITQVSRSEWSRERFVRLQLLPKTNWLIQPASKVRDRTLARKGGKGPEMTLNFAVKAAWALNRTRLEMEAGGQQTRASTDAGREKKVRFP